MNKRAVITGMGILAPNGTGVSAFWHSLLHRHSGIARIALFDTEGFPAKIAGEVKGFDLHPYTNGKFKPQRLGRHTQLALAATKLAVEDAGLTPAQLESHPGIPVVVGVSTTAMDLLERADPAWDAQKQGRISPFVVSGSQPHALAATMVEFLGMRAWALTVSTACQSGLDALAIAADLVRQGRSDLAFAGAADAPITRAAVSMFAASGLIAMNADDPATVSRPFDRDHYKGVLAEAGAILVVEDLDRARARGARVYAEVTGSWQTMDVTGRPPGSGLADTMAGACANAFCYPQDIDYVCAHGPSDKVVDCAEVDAIKAALREHAFRIPVSSIKGCTGNPLSAAGPLQCAATALAIRHGVVPPTANHRNPAEGCDLDFVSGGPRYQSVRCAIINNHGLGGGNTSLVMRRVEA